MVSVSMAFPIMMKYLFKYRNKSEAFPIFLEEKLDLGLEPEIERATHDLGGINGAPSVSELIQATQVIIFTSIGYNFHLEIED